MDVLLGKNIKRISTLDSMYGHGMVEIEDVEGTYYRLKVDSLLPILQQMQFPIEQKRKYGHLIVGNYKVGESINTTV